MKANDEERQRFDKAVDEILDLFNNLEDDQPIIKFGDDVLENIGLAKKKYGDDMVNEKINTVVREMLSWLDLENVESDEEDESENNAVEEEEQ
ncbi:hypothetical protein [Virgibacillus sediminis]|uniref:Atypical membrane-integrating protein (Mistic protein) n=1 Tax=Virgibacillus sediminis TaxID=202260 RepID=A0ABV7A9R5_9BACI